MALDLKKLEQKLDDALAKETSESIRKWLLSKRMKKIYCLFLFFVVLFGCQKDETTSSQPSPPICKTCITTGYQKTNQQATINYPITEKKYCNNEWLGKETTTDTTIIKYNSITHKNDTTYYWYQTKCQ